MSQSSSWHMVAYWYMMVVNSSDYGDGGSGLVLTHHLPNGPHSVNYLTSLCFIFLTCQVLKASIQGLLWYNACPTLRIVPGSVHKYSTNTILLIFFVIKGLSLQWLYLKLPTGQGSVLYFKKIHNYPCAQKCL